MASYTKYEEWIEHVCQKEVDLFGTTDTFKVIIHTDAPVVASGGVSTIDDLVAISTLVDAGVEGAIIGTALYTGEFTLEDALAAVSR